MTRPIKVYDGDPIRFTGVTDAHLSWRLAHASLEEPIQDQASASSDKTPVAPKYYYRERFRALDETGKRTILTYKDRQERDAEGMQLLAG